MNPPLRGDQCPHSGGCCVDQDVPHEHLQPPEKCAKCIALAEPEQLRTPGSFLIDKAYRVASKRHPEAFPKDGHGNPVAPTQEN